MKRLMGFLLCLLLVLGCTGCKDAPEGNPPLNFYYRTASLSFSAGSTSIKKEARDVPEQDSWAQVLNIYLAGPEDSSLRSPFPANLQTVKTTMENKTVYITVTRELAALTGLDLTLACSCLALTCLELTGAQTVVISAEGELLFGQKSITMTKDTLLISNTAGGE